MNENTPGLLDIAGGLINPEGDSDFEKEESRNATFEDFTNLLVRSFVPTGSQIKKSVEGYNSTQNDGVVLRDDRVRFIQNAKPDDMLRNPYSLDSMQLMTVRNGSIKSSQPYPKNKVKYCNSKKAKKQSNVLMTSTLAKTCWH